jgi:uncharacterized protein (TIGR02271 family)
VIPIVEEKVDVQKHKVQRDRVRVHKTVSEHEEVVDEPLYRENAEVVRVPVNRVVDGPVPVHHDGSTLVVPLLEEVLVVEKRLLLREELRITMNRKEIRDTRKVTLRAEDVTVERLPGDEPGKAFDGDNT